LVSELCGMSNYVAAAVGCDWVCSTVSRIPAPKDKSISTTGEMMKDKGGRK